MNPVYKHYCCPVVDATALPGNYQTTYDMTVTPKCSSFILFLFSNAFDLISGNKFRENTDPNILK